MKARQLAPNLGTFAGILTASVQKRNFGVSRKYFEEMAQVLPVSNAINTMLQYCSWKSSLKHEGMVFGMLSYGYRIYILLLGNFTSPQ